MAGSIQRITVLTGDPRLPDVTKHNARYGEVDAATHAAMRAALCSLPGFEFVFVDDHSTLLDYFRERPPDLVVNFCDTGFRNQATQELHIPAYLEMLDIPYTGAPPAAMVICYDKAMVRLVADSLHVAVPREHFIAADAPRDALPDLYPAILKPNTGDGSVGITKDAVVRSPAAAKIYLHWLRRNLPGRDALMQEYLPGSEFGFGVIGNPRTGLRIFPPLEVDYSGLPPGLNPILSFESKAIPDSPYWTDIRFKRASLAPELEEKMKGWVRILFHRLGLRDYARFDFRVAADGEPRLMEVNPNPAWANDGKLAFMAGFDGLEYQQMLELLLQAAMQRLAAQPVG